MNVKLFQPFKIANLLFYWTGLWSLNATKKFRIIRTISQIVIFAFLIFTILAMSKGLFRGTLTTRATHVSIGIISLLGVFDALVLVHSEKFRKFMKVMTENEEFLNSNPNLTLRKIHQDGMKNIWPTFNFLLNFVVITVTMILFVQTALMHTLRELEHEEECRKSDDCSLLLLETWYCPFGVDDHYWWANIFELACGIICVLLNFERDIYFTNFISYIRCRLRILAYVLHKWDEFIQKNENEVGYFEEVDDLLRCCLSEHQNIIREFEELKGMLSFLFFLMVTLNVPIVLFGLLMILKSDQLIHYLSAVVYSSSYAVSHLFMVLWQSENLSSESQQLADAIYNSPWYELRTDQQKALLLMMIRSRKPFVLNCGFICFATVDTFVKTIKSVYTFLNAVIKISN